MHYLLLAFHWNACFFHLVHRNSGFGTPPAEELMGEMEAGGGGGVGGADRSAFSDMRYPVPGESVMTYLMSYYW